jgi:ABC transporter substrate binding protein
VVEHEPTVFTFTGAHLSSSPSTKPGQLHNRFPRVGVFIDQILTGASPADLPVEQSTKSKLVINLNTAKALGLTIPPAVLAGADEVIQ